MLYFPFIYIGQGFFVMFNAEKYFWNFMEKWRLLSVFTLSEPYRNAFCHDSTLFVSNCKMNLLKRLNVTASLQEANLFTTLPLSVSFAAEKIQFALWFVRPAVGVYVTCKFQARNCSQWKSQTESIWAIFNANCLNL